MMWFLFLDETAQNLGLINKTVKSLVIGECISQCNGNFVQDYVFDLVHHMFDCRTETAYQVHTIDMQNFLFHG